MAGRPRSTGRTAKSSSVSIKAHVQLALDEHHITPTRALDQWYDWVLERESAWYEGALLEKQSECAMLEKKVRAAKERERKVQENQYRVSK